MSVVVALTLPVVALMVNAVEFLAGVVTRKRAKAYRTSVARPHNGTPFPTCRAAAHGSYPNSRGRQQRRSATPLMRCSRYAMGGSDECSEHSSPTLRRLR